MEREVDLHDKKTSTETRETPAVDGLSAVGSAEPYRTGQPLFSGGVAKWHLDWGDYSHVTLVVYFTTISTFDLTNSPRNENFDSRFHVVLHTTLGTRSEPVFQSESPGHSRLQHSPHTVAPPLSRWLTPKDWLTPRPYLGCICKLHTQLGTKAMAPPGGATSNRLDRPKTV